MLDRVVCINLDRRPERWEQFQRRLPADWPFGPVQRLPAVDGEQVELPAWYGGEWRNALAGAYGCLQSHLKAWRDAAAQGACNLFVLEDDAVFAPDFSRQAQQLVSRVPDGWDQIYFGGQHLRTDERMPAPLRYEARVLRGCCVNRTHAYAVSSGGLAKLVQRFSEPWSAGRKEDWHVDHQLGGMHWRGELKAYCPLRWLVGQVMGIGDVSGCRYLSNLFWQEFPVSESPVPC